MSEASHRLEGKVAIVTGAGRGIGKAIAERYSREGAVLTIVDVDPTTTDRVVHDILTAGGKAIGIVANVGNSSDVSRLVASTIDQFGTIDILVNNAGIVRESVRHVLDSDEEWWDRILSTNLKGQFLCSLAVAKHMVRHGGGTIITMSSGGASRAHRGMVAYDASKGGIEALTRALALDLAPYGIRVVGLIPGLIVPSRESTSPDALALTDATVPLGRAGIPEDIAGPAVFLASDDAAYITGSFVTVDGGVLSQQRSPQVETFSIQRFPHPELMTDSWTGQR